jgi:Skp family chaperone for outer membrane proteins
MRGLVIVALGLLWPSGVALAQGAADTRPTVNVGIFSPQRAFVESGQGRDAAARLDAAQAEKAKTIEERQRQLQAQRDALESAVAVLNDTARLQRVREIERFELDVQRFVEDAQAELMGLRTELESAFLARLGPAVEAVAGQKGLSLVLNLDADAVVWAVPAIDITDEVVRELDAGTP